MRFFPLLQFASVVFYLGIIQAKQGLFAPISDKLVLKQLDSKPECMNKDFAELHDLITRYTTFLLRDGVDKRDTFQSNFEDLLVAFNRSGLLPRLIDQISHSTQQMDTISNYILKTMVSMRANNSTSSLNATGILNATQNHTKNLAQSIVQELLFDDLQLIQLANSVGSILVNYSWIGEVVNFIGVHGQIDMNDVFRIAQDYKSKDPGFNGTSYGLSKRESRSNNSYNGSLQAFLNNIIGSAVQSEFASATTSSIIDALDDSGIAPSVIQQLLADQNLFNIIGYIANKLHKDGALDVIDLNTLFKKQKDSGQLSKSLSYILDNPLISPRIARIFYQLRNNGALKQLRYNVIGKP